MPIENSQIVLYKQTLEELQQQLNNSTRYVLSSTMKVVDSKSMGDRIQALIETLPKAMQEAATVIQEQDTLRQRNKTECQKLLNDAKAEAASILSQAKEAQKAADDALAQSGDKCSRIQAEAEQLARQFTQQAKDNADQIVQQAMKEAQKIHTNAMMEANQLVSNEEVYMHAKVEADRILADANAKANDLHQRVFAYLDDMMNRAQTYLGNISEDIEGEREELNSRR